MADDEEWPQELTWGANDYGRYRWCPWRGPGSDGGGGQSRSNRQNAARERRRANRWQEREDEDEQRRNAVQSNEQERFALAQELQQERSALARVSQELQQERSAGAQAQQQLKVKEVIVNKLLEHQSKLVRDGEAGDLLSVGVLNKRPFFLVYIYITPIRICVLKWPVVC